MAKVSINRADEFKSGEGISWFKLKNHGEKATIQFLHTDYESVPLVTFHKVPGNNNYDVSVDCLRQSDADPIDVCPFCSAGIKLEASACIYIYNHKENAVEVWERSISFLKNNLKTYFDYYNPLHGKCFDIVRSGQPGDKKTSYTLISRDDIPPYDLTEFPVPDHTFVLNKTAEEMEQYVLTGSFDSGPQVSVPPLRRTPASPTITPRVPLQSQPTATQPAPRNTANPAPVQPPVQKASNRMTTGQPPVAPASPQTAPTNEDLLEDMPF